MKNAITAQVPRLLSIAEVAWLLGVDNSRVCRAIRLGRLPVVRRRGGRVLIPAHVLAHLSDGDLPVADRCAEPPAGASGRGGA
ncbi:helix-turn-helix domain-containing protein [Actinophytocola sp. KF-1]